MSEHLIETLENGVCTLTMNRPEARNAMSGPMMQALNEAVPRVAAEKKCACRGANRCRWCFLCGW